MHKKNILFFATIIPLLTGCSFSVQSKENKFLNYKYVLTRAGDIHESSVTSGVTLNKISGFDSYISLFDTKKSYINCQCVGNNFDEFKTETSIVLYDKKGNKVFGDENHIFYTKLGKNSKFDFFDEEEHNKIGDIYFNIIYWTRWQFDYDVKGDGNKITITFEFMKNSFNDLPEWSL